MQQEHHEVMAPVSWLVGRWITLNGRGQYSSIDLFDYHEEMQFVCVGQPMLNYSSVSKHPTMKTPLHQERGFLRVKPETNHVAFMVSHNFGLTSLEEGTCDGENMELHLETVELARMSFATPPVVKKYRRHYRLIAPNTLQFRLFMETDTTPMSLHLQAVYKKVLE